MHVLEALRQLRDADQEWAIKGQEYQTLRGQLTDQSELLSRRKAQQQREKELTETRGQLRDQELELQGLEARRKEVNRQLYADGNLSPRELEHLRHDAEYLDRHIDSLEVAVLELLTRVEALQQAAEQGAAELAAYEETYRAENAASMARYRVLRQELQALQDRRQALRSAIAPQALQLYDDLWRSRNGSPLARLVDGRCEACNVNVPREKARSVEAYEPQVLTCDGCGRILILG